jgi:hypothetical protein
VVPAEVDALLEQVAALNAPDLPSLLNEVFHSQSYEGERTIKYANQAGHALSLIYRATGPGGTRPALSRRCGATRI